MSRTNETRHIEWHETCKCKCRLDTIVCNNKQRWNEDKCWCKCKELIDKGMCDKGFNWNPSNCEFECNKLYDFGEYLGYENFKGRKKLVDQIIDECNETVDEVEILNESKNKCNSCILYIVLFSIFFTINVGIGAYFIYYKYVNRNEETGSRYNYVYQAESYYYKMGLVKQIDIKNRTYYFCNDIIDIKNVDAKLLKIDKKVIQKHWYLLHWIHHN